MFRHVAIALTLSVITWSQAFAEYRVLAFGDSNTWGWIPSDKGFPTQRYPDAVRWPGVLEAELRKTLPNATVVVDGLSGRTINTPYAEAQHGIDGHEFAGLPRIASATAAALPVNLVIIMLGTNDARSDLNVLPESASRDIAAMVERVRSINGGVATDYPTPQVLVIAPPAIGDTSKTPISGVTLGSDKRSSDIAAAIVAKGKVAGFLVFDANRVVAVKSVDGVHFTPENHKALGEALAAEVLKLAAK